MKMKLNLKQNSLFEDEYLEFSDESTFIYGKNGSGKSTICDLAKEQFEDIVFLFSGFDNIITTNEKLDAILLGEKNNTIDTKIKEIENKISSENIKLDLINQKILDNGTANYYKEKFDKKENYI